MTFNSANIESIANLSQKVKDLLEILEASEEEILEEQAIAGEYGEVFDRLPEDEWMLADTWTELRSSWAQLVSACGGNKALAAEASGRSLADIEYYLSE